MNEKAQALVDALKAVGIDATYSTWRHNGYVQIDIDHSEDDDEAGTSEWNTHFKWNLGENKGFSIILDNNGKCTEITE